MLGYIWAFMIILSFLFGTITGNISEVTAAALSGAQDGAVTVFSLLGMMCFWAGLLEIAKQSGLTEKISVFLSPIILRLFPMLKKESAAFGAIVMSIIANLLGLSNAATPLGLKAMAELNKENKNSPYASDAMCMFVVINSAAFTLVPSTVIALLNGAGSENAAEILIPSWITSAAALFAAVLSAKFFAKKDKRR